LAAGRTFNAQEEHPGAGIPVAIASYSLWRRSGFDPAFIGKTVRINATDVTIVGVAPKGFGGTGAALLGCYLPARRATDRAARCTALRMTLHDLQLTFDHRDVVAEDERCESR
jgi:hypothetical protein